MTIQKYIPCILALFLLAGIGVTACAAKKETPCSTLEPANAARWLSAQEYNQALGLDKEIIYDAMSKKPGEHWQGRITGIEIKGHKPTGRLDINVGPNQSIIRNIEDVTVLTHKKPFMFSDEKLSDFQLSLINFLFK